MEGEVFIVREEVEGGGLPEVVGKGGWVGGEVMFE